MIDTVGEIAKKLNGTALTLRYYGKECLLPFAERSGNGMCVFKDAADIIGLNQNPITTGADLVLFFLFSAKKRGEWRM